MGMGIGNRQWEWEYLTAEPGNGNGNGNGNEPMGMGGNGNKNVIPAHLFVLCVTDVIRLVKDCGFCRCSCLWRLPDLWPCITSRFSRVYESLGWLVVGSAWIHQRLNTFDLIHSYGRPALCTMAPFLSGIGNGVSVALESFLTVNSPWRARQPHHQCLPLCVIHVLLVVHCIMDIAHVLVSALICIDYCNECRLSSPSSHIARLFCSRYIRRSANPQHLWLSALAWISTDTVVSYKLIMPAGSS